MVVCYIMYTPIEECSNVAALQSMIKVATSNAEFAKLFSQSLREAKLANKGMVYHEVFDQSAHYYLCHHRRTIVKSTLADSEKATIFRHSSNRHLSYRDPKRPEGLEATVLKSSLRNLSPSRKFGDCRSGCLGSAPLVECWYSGQIIP